MKREEEKNKPTKGTQNNRGTKKKDRRERVEMRQNSYKHMYTACESSAFVHQK